MDELERQYLKILSDIAKDRNLIKLSKYIDEYDKIKVQEEVKPIIKPKYNITHLPEAVCDGCEG